MQVFEKRDFTREWCSSENVQNICVWRPSLPPRAFLHTLTAGRYVTPFRDPTEALRGGGGGFKEVVTEPPPRLCVCFQLCVFWPKRGLQADYGTVRKSAMFPQPSNQKKLK